MKLNEAKQKFIHAWGVLGTNWGINKTMAQIHALLMVSTKPLSTDDIMEQLNISRGNVNMNTRTLMDWGLVFKEFVSGERKEFFVAEKDILNVSRRIIKERRKREIEPLRQVLSQLKNIDDPKEESKEREEFAQLIYDIDLFTEKMDALSEKYIRSDEKWFYKVLLKMI